MHTRLLLLLSLFMLGGCASLEDHAIFVTKSSIDIGFDTTPPTVNIGYDRIEGYLGPRYEDGRIPPVAGSIRTKGNVFDREVRQVYATGKAATTVTNLGGSAPDPCKPTVDCPVESDKHKTMFFGTTTSIGLKLSFGQPALIDSFSLGYKRKELSIIPITESGHFPSVLATLDTEVEPEAGATTRWDAKQFFATGKAAEQLAMNQDVKRMFEAEAVGEFIMRYRTNERAQYDELRRTAVCLVKVKDERLSQVFANVDALPFFNDKGSEARTNSMSAAEKREYYLKLMSQIDAASEEYTGVMKGHRAFVCDLAKRP